MARLLILFAASVALAGCADEACFRWTRAMSPTEHPTDAQVCPARKDAAMFMGKCAVQTVESDGTFDEKASTCCYSITKPKTSPNDPSCPSNNNSNGNGPGGFD